MAVTGQRTDCISWDVPTYHALGHLAFQIRQTDLLSLFCVIGRVFDAVAAGGRCRLGCSPLFVTSSGIVQALNFRYPYGSPDLQLTMAISRQLSQHVIVITVVGFGWFRCAGGLLLPAVHDWHVSVLAPNVALVHRFTVDFDCTTQIM